MGYKGNPEYITPEFLLHDDTVMHYAELLSLASEHGLYNVVKADLSLLFIEYERLIQHFVVCFDKIASAKPLLDRKSREAIAVQYRRAAMNGQEITPRVAQFIDYLAGMLER